MDEKDDSPEVLTASVLTMVHLMTAENYTTSKPK
jgi:hypothetical protein